MKSPLFDLTTLFLTLSLLAVGGLASVIPEMHREVVEVQGWMSSGTFADLYAIAQASPGPNMMVVTLIGWHVGGLAGAFVATAACCAPSCLLTYFVHGLWDRFKDAPWRRIVQRGLAPVTAGLVLASGYIVTRGAVEDWQAYVVTGITLFVALRTRIHPLWVMAVSGVLGVLGLL